MNSIRKIQIIAASTLVGLALCGCSHQEQTTDASQSNQEAIAQSTTPQTTAPAPTNNPPDPTTVPPPLPETSMQTSTNVLPTAAPLPVTQ